jgi:hypothetical protein
LTHSLRVVDYTCQIHSTWSGFSPKYFIFFDSSQKCIDLLYFLYNISNSKHILAVSVNVPEFQQKYFSTEFFYYYMISKLACQKTKQKGKLGAGGSCL